MVGFWYGSHHLPTLYASIAINRHIGRKNNVYYTKAELTKSNYRFVKLSCIYQYIFIKTDE